jgi:hypothetical protein
MISGLEIILCVIVLVAAGISYNRGWAAGVDDGAEAAIDVMVEAGELSRFRNDEGEVEVCSSGVMNDICPKCGFQEGDSCGAHA